MDEYSIGSPRDAEARRLGQDAALSFFNNPVEGDTMESFVVGEVTGEIVRLTRAAQRAKQSEIKAWRRRHFLAPVSLAVMGIVVAIATTPRTGGGSAVGPLIGVMGLVAGVSWLIANAFRASSRIAQSQNAREVETGRLLQIARDAAASTYREVGDADRADPVVVAGADADASESPEVPALDDADAEADADATPPRTPEDDAAARDRAREERRVAGSPPPPGQPFGVTQGGAEYLVAAWMRHLGESDAATTHETGEGSLHVASARCVAQVSNDVALVDGEAIRELVAVAASDGRRALYFTTGSYTDDAVALAAEAGATLFTYDATAGTLDGANALGETAMIEGLR